MLPGNWVECIVCFKSFDGEEFDILRRVFKATLAEDWFERSTENDWNFAGFMARTYQNGVTDEATLKMIAEAAAKQRYAKRAEDKRLV